MDSDTNGGGQIAATTSVDLKGLSIRIEQAEGILIANLSGRVDGTNYRDFQDAVGGMLVDGPVGLLLDLEGVSFLSSAGLSSLLSLARKVRKRGGRIAVCSLAESVQAVFRISGFHMVVPAHDTRAEALSSLGG